MQIKFSARNIDKVKAFIASVDRPLKIEAMKAFIEYIIGDENEGLKHEPAEKFVSRKRAYGKVSDAPDGYFSWKQFRYVAAITEGFTKAYSRTHEMASDWTMQVKDSNWTRVTAENAAEGAVWVFGDKQARQPALVGWRKYADTLKARTAGGIRSATAAVNRLLKSMGKK
jgi:hypothetical protein